MASQEVRSWLVTANHHIDQYNEQIEGLDESEALDRREAVLANASFSVLVALTYAVTDVANAIDDLVRKQH